MLTKSTAAEDIEWGVPKNWERLDESELRELVMRTKADATEDHVGLMDSVNAFATDDTNIASSSSNGVEAEPETEMSKLNREVSEFKVNVEQHARKYSEVAIEASSLLKKARAQKGTSRCKYIDGLIDDCTALIGKVSKLEKIQKKAVEVEVECAEIPKCLDAMKNVDRQFEEIKEWAVTFNLVTSSKRRRLAKKTPSDA